jgi:hypothetical protein
MNVCPSEYHRQNQPRDQQELSKRQGIMTPQQPRSKLVSEPINTAVVKCLIIATHHSYLTVR